MCISYHTKLDINFGSRLFKAWTESDLFVVMLTRSLVMMAVKMVKPLQGPQHSNSLKMSFKLEPSVTCVNER